MILCTGEALIDMVPADGGFRPLPGGAVYNTAIALGRLGAPTGFLWPISRDGFGEMLLPPLAEAGVEAAFSPRSDRLTTLAFVTLSDGDARYAFYDEGSAGRMFAPQDIPDLSGVQAIFCGGISLVPDPCGGTIEALVARESAQRVVMIDPNIRPFFITDEAPYRARLKRMLAQADLVKFSGDDLSWLFPDMTAEAAAQAVLSLGPKAVFLTCGGAGAQVFWEGGPLSAQAPKVAVADTIGAGDTFNAGVLAALAKAVALNKADIAALDAATLQAALDLGVRAAAITVSRAGANPPWQHELKETA